MPEVGGQVGAIALSPIFGRLVNPIPIIGRLCLKLSKNLEGQVVMGWA